MMIGYPIKKYFYKKLCYKGKSLISKLELSRKSSYYMHLFIICRICNSFVILLHPKSNNTAIHTAFSHNLYQNGATIYLLKQGIPRIIIDKETVNRGKL